MVRPRLRTSFNILAARAKGSGSPFTRSKATFFYQLQAFVLILGGMGTMVVVGPGGALETDPQRVRFSGILPGFDPLQKGGSATCIGASALGGMVPCAKHRGTPAF